MFLSGLESKLGAAKGLGVFNDLREPERFRDASERFGEHRVPAAAAEHGRQRVARQRQLQTDDLRPGWTDTGRPSPPAHASNALLVTARRSANGHPLMVAGPQIGYYYPGLTMEVDLHGPGIDARGVTAATIGYVLIGRSEDYAWSLTSAGLDIIDTYVETLCGGSDTKYEYKGRCVDMHLFDAGVLKGTPDQQHRVLRNRPRSGHRIRDSARSQGRDHEEARELPGATRSTCCCTATSPSATCTTSSDFFRAADQSPQTFNSFYVDDRDIGVFTSGLLPIRPANVDPGLPIDGRGNEEWQGFVPASKHPQGINPPNGQIVNWNNKTIAGYQAPDDNWSFGAEQRVQLLTNNLGTGGGQTLAVADRGDEQGRDARRARDAVRTAARGGVEDRPAPDCARRADARAARQVARERWQSPRPQPRRQDRRSRRGNHGRGVDEARRRVGRAGARVARPTSSRRSSRRSTRRRAASTAAGTSIWTRTSAPCSGGR